MAGKICKSNQRNFKPMIEIFGPTYRYSGEILTKPEILYINDHHYDEENQCFHIKTLLENSQCDPQQHLLVFDHINHDDELTGYNSICLPVFLAAEVNEFIRQKIVPDWNNKTHTFNFMINKPRMHREFLLLLIEYFGLSNYTYSLPWKKINVRRSTLKKLINNSLYEKIINDTEIVIAPTNYAFGSEITLDQGIKNGNYQNAETYNHLLKTNVFEPSCISLITEPSFFEKETLHTEKTIMAFYGGTLPIWVGGWKLATYARSIGFDIFDDIIDHSYEMFDDPWDRCFNAIKLNLDLLKDFDRVKNFIGQNQMRLKHNIDLIETNPFLTKIIKIVESYNEPVRSQLFSIVSTYRHNMFKSFTEIRLLGERIGKSGQIYKR